MFTSFDGSVTSVPYPVLPQMAKVELNLHYRKLSVVKPRNAAEAHMHLKRFGGEVGD